MRLSYLARYLTPADGAARVAPADFTLVEDRITRGLPHRVTLDGTFGLLLVAPTGVATAWRDADPAAVISQGADERTGRPAPGIVPPVPGAITRHPVRLLLLHNGEFLGSVPLIAGLRRVLPEAHPTIGAGIELMILDWITPAGSVRGLGDYGGRLSLAWRAL